MGDDTTLTYFFGRWTLLCWKVSSGGSMSVHSNSSKMKS